MKTPPSERELDVLKVLWEIGAGSVRDVRDKLSQSEDLAFNTVQTFLRSMEDKGLVRHREEGRTFVYEPIIGPENIAGRLLNKVFGGSLRQMVTAMLDGQEPTSDELRELEKLIAARRRERDKEAKGGNP